MWNFSLFGWFPTLYPVGDCGNFRFLFWSLPSVPPARPCLVWSVRGHSRWPAARRGRTTPARRCSRPARGLGPAGIIFNIFNRNIFSYAMSPPGCWGPPGRGPRCGPRRTVALSGPQTGRHCSTSTSRTLTILNEIFFNKTFFAKHNSRVENEKGSFHINS